MIFWVKGVKAMTKTIIVTQLKIAANSLVQAKKDLQSDDLKSLYNQLNILQSIATRMKKETIDMVFDKYSASLNFPKPEKELDFESLGKEFLDEEDQTEDKKENLDQFIPFE